jgi:hypothetical protein
MTEDLQPAQTSTRGDAVFVLLVFAVALAIAAYFANPAFAAWINGLRDWAMGPLG